MISVFKLPFLEIPWHVHILSKQRIFNHRYYIFNNFKMPASSDPFLRRRFIRELANFEL